jgi:glyoxylase-like metal-dependent hydrolase (beta-lactamase superfamily II)
MTTHEQKSTSGAADRSDVITPEKDLFLIPLDQELTGFYRFISSWVYTAGPVFLIDVGPASTAHRLIETLSRLGVRRLDAILLTHIHLDHAGGIGEVAGAFPDAPVFCHPTAVSHLVDPTRLWEGSLKILGETAKAYGPILPVSESRIQPIDKAVIPGGVGVIETPGHAVHHVSYKVGPYLFAGEAGGVVFSSDHEPLYMRPATPVRFLFDVFARSIDRLIALDPDAVCYGHFGFQRNGTALFKRHRAQLERWRSIISREMKQSAPDSWLQVCVDRLLKEDPDLSAFSGFEPAIQTREKGFMENSVRGFLEFLSATQ